MQGSGQFMHPLFKAQSNFKHGQYGNAKANESVDDDVDACWIGDGIL